MSENFLRLEDKTIFVGAANCGLIRSLLQQLMDLGSDVGWYVKADAEAQRYSDAMNDLREIRPDSGRLMLLDSKLSVKDATDSLAQSLGGLDAAIAMSQNREPGEADLKILVDVFDAASSFFLKRGRGRILWIWNQPQLEDSFGLDERIRLSFAEKLELSKPPHFTFNGLRTGLNETWLLNHFPKNSVKESLKTVKEKWPKERYFEDSEIGQLITFLISPASSALNGSIL